MRSRWWHVATYKITFRCVVVVYISTAGSQKETLLSYFLSLLRYIIIVRKHSCGSACPSSFSLPHHHIAAHFFFSSFFFFYESAWVTSTFFFTRKKVQSDVKKKKKKTKKEKSFSFVAPFWRDVFGYLFRRRARWCRFTLDRSGVSLCVCVCLSNISDTWWFPYDYARKKKKKSPIRRRRRNPEKLCVYYVYTLLFLLKVLGCLFLLFFFFPLAGFE